MSQERRDGLETFLEKNSDVDVMSEEPKDDLEKNSDVDIISQEPKDDLEKNSNVDVMLQEPKDDLGNFLEKNSDVDIMSEEPKDDLVKTFLEKNSDVDIMSQEPKTDSENLLEKNSDVDIMSQEPKDDLKNFLEKNSDVDIMSQEPNDDLEKFLEKNPDVDIIRFHWIDYSGVLRTRFVPAARCLAIVDEHEDYLIPQTSMIVPVSTTPKFFPSGMDVEVLGLRPDCRSLRICGFKPNHASVMCYVEQKNGPEEQQDDLCPRSALVDLLDRFEPEDPKDGEILAGFEIEFMLLDQNSQPLNDLDRLSSYQTTAGLRGKTLDIVEEIVHCLEKSSIKIHHFHTETRDQIEIALSPEPLLNAIDSFVLAQETIRTVFVRHNIRATMTPKPLLEGPTNGVHLHMSMNHMKLEDTDKFLAGIMQNIRPLCAFGMASYDSYARAIPNAAGVWAGWGTENRDLPVRRIHEHHWEFRMMDATANPYLFAGMVLAAGFTGVQFGLELSLNDCRVFPHDVNQEQGNIRFGLTEKMPTSLREALESLSANEGIRESEYEKIWSSYIWVKEKEIEIFEQMTPEDRRRKFLEYF